MLSYIICQYFGFHLKKIARTSDQIHSCYIYDDRKIYVFLKKKSDDLKENRRMYLFVVIAFKNVYKLVDINLFDFFVENLNSFSVGAYLFKRKQQQTN